MPGLGLIGISTGTIVLLVGLHVLVTIAILGFSGDTFGWIDRPVCIPQRVELMAPNGQAVYIEEEVPAVFCGTPFGRIVHPEQRVADGPTKEALSRPDAGTLFNVSGAVNNVSKSKNLVLGIAGLFTLDYVVLGGVFGTLIRATGILMSIGFFLGLGLYLVNMFRGSVLR